jgi:hypothetical protein
MGVWGTRQMNYKGRAVKLKARTADGVKSRQSIAIAVDGIEGVVKIEELWKSKIRGGGAIVVLTGLRLGVLAKGAVKIGTDVLER